MGKIDADNKGRCLVYSIQLQKVSELARRGETKRQAGDFVGAISDFDLALQLDPHDVSALRSRGDAKRMLDDFAGAIEDLDAALKLEPRNAFALRSRGDAKRMVDDHMGAIHDLDLALQLEPRNPVALSSRGDAKRMLEDSMGAIADLDIAIQMDPKNAFALSSRAASKRLMGDFLGAIADLDRALEMDPTDAFALRHRGEAKRLARDFVGAIQDLDLALVIEPANALALWRRGEAKRQQGDVMGAMGDLNLALQLEPINATALCSRSDTKLMLQDYMGAMEDLDAAVQLEPANAAALRSRGELKRLSGDFQGSIEDLDRSLQLEPQNAVALSSRGDAKRMLDDCQGALADLDLALELDPNNALDLARRGEVKREQGDFAGAINDLDFALELEPRNVVALSSRGDAKRMLNDCVGALEDLDLALQIEPDNPFALCCRGEAKKIEESRWFVQKADSLGPLNCLMSQQLKWAIIGAGPVGLTLALTLAESMQSRGLDPEVATVEIYLSWIEQDNSKWQRKRGTLSVEMVTLQDPVLDSLSPELRSAFTGGSSPRPSGRSAPVAGIEMKLLEKAQQPPFNTYIRIHDYAETDVQPMWLSSLCCDVIVSDSALTRRAFPGAFVNPAAPQVDVEAQQLPLSDAEGNESNLVEADFALGINLSFGASKQARFNAIFSMAQNIYQLSSDEVSDSGNGRRARDQVVTLQDSVVELLSPDIQSAFEGENVWLQSRNVPVAEIEEKLLEKAQQAPYKEYIRIHQCDLLSDEQQHAEWIKGLDADFVVAADGAASLSRRAFPDAFVYCVAEGANRDAQQIRLGETASEFDEADYALGIALKPETTPPQKQALNVVLTLAQTVYLLNSQEGSRGFLNIRVTKEEYDAIFLATGNRGCTFGSPIRLFKEEDLYLITDDQPSEIKVQLPWLRRRIEEGLKLFGMQLDHMQFITGFQLRPSYAQCSYHVLPSTSSTAQKVLLLAGDAAISHHFWPGRGLNTGLKSAAAIVKMWCHPQATAAEGLKKYDIFMGKLRQREMQGRSASMMRNEMRLPWGSTLLSPKSPEAQQLKRMAVEQEPVNRQKFLKNCKLWRDFLERSPGWPHERLTDKELEERIVRRVIRPKELELRLMLSSAFDNGPGRAAGWPTSMQGGSEVDPSHEEHWK